jgi:hypothetical protein
MTSPNGFGTALSWVPVDRQFQFIRSQTVVFDTRRSVQNPEQLAAIIPSLSASSVFFHFVDARQRLTESEDDFRFWLSSWGDRYGALRERLSAIDPYFISLSELRDQVSAIFGDYFGVTV